MALPITLGKEPIPKLLKEYAVPAIIAMTASSMYNMVDSIFIGHGVGALAISGLAVTFPFMNLASAFGSLVGVGASTLLSVKLGAKDYAGAQKIVGNVVMLNVIIGVCFTVVSLLFLDPILYFFGASDNTIAYAREYMQIILLGNVVTHLYLGLNSVIRSSGHPRQAMAATIVTVVLNAILDPLFIFGFGWGIRGAAIATILAQVVSLIWVIRILCGKNEVVRLHRGIFRIDSKIALDSLSIGLAPFLMNVASCFIVILINKGLQTHGGDLAIGAFGIVNRVSFIFIMIVMGFNQGMQPIAGYNYGARQMSRVMEVFWLTVKCATVITTVGFLQCELFPRLIAGVFTSDEELLSYAIFGLRVTLVMYPLVGFQMVVSNFFQSIGMASRAIFLSLTRQLIFLIPALWILPELGSGGREIGRRVAEKLGCGFYDKELLLEAAKKSGLAPECFEKADERAERSIGTGLFGMRFPFLGDGASSIVPGFTNDTIFQIQSDTLRSIAETEKNGVVFVGRCADYVLRDMEGLLNVFVSADEEDRVKRVMSYFSCSESAARDKIHKVDRQRASYYEYYTSKDWGMAQSYHLCLNSSRFGVERCVGVILSAADGCGAE